MWLNLPVEDRQKLLREWADKLDDIDCQCGEYSSRECYSCKGKYAAFEMLLYLKEISNSKGE